MKKERILTIWFKRFNQLLIGLIILVLTLYVLKNRSQLSIFGDAVPLVCIGVLLILEAGLLWVTLRGLTSSRLLADLNPASSQKKGDLGKDSQYQLGFGSWPLEEEPLQTLKRVAQSAVQQGAHETGRYRFGLVFEKKASTPLLGFAGAADRLIFLYRPILGREMTKQLMTEALNYALSDRSKAVRRTFLFILTDMKEPEPKLEAASEIVSFRSRIQSGVIFLPTLCDIRLGRFYEPSELSALTPSDRWAYEQLRREFLNSLLPTPADLNKPAEGRV